MFDSCSVVNLITRTLLPYIEDIDLLVRHIITIFAPWKIIPLTVHYVRILDPLLHAITSENVGISIGYTRWPKATMTSRFFHRWLTAPSGDFLSSLPTISHATGSTCGLHWIRSRNSSPSSRYFSRLSPSTAPDGSQASWLPENPPPGSSTKKPSLKAIPNNNNKVIDIASVELENASVRNSSWNKDPVSRKVLVHKEAMKRLFPDGWAPPRKISREAMDGLRTLHRHDPNTFNTPVLAEKFKISPEAVRRILKSRWQPDEKRQVQMAEKEMQLREEWRVRKRQEEDERKATTRQKPVEMFMDQESDEEFLGGIERSRSTSSR